MYTVHLCICVHVDVCTCMGMQCRRVYILRMCICVVVDVWMVCIVRICVSTIVNTTNQHMRICVQWMCVCVYAYLYLYWLCVYMCVHGCTCVWVVYMCVSIWMYMCGCTCDTWLVYVCVYASVIVHMYMCVQTQVHRLVLWFKQKVTAHQVRSKPISVTTKVCMCACASVWVCAWVHVGDCICECTVHVCDYIYTHICMYVCVSVCACTCDGLIRAPSSPLHSCFAPLLILNLHTCPFPLGQGLSGLHMWGEEQAGWAEEEQETEGAGGGAEDAEGQGEPTELWGVWGERAATESEK